MIKELCSCLFKAFGEDSKKWKRDIVFIFFCEHTAGAVSLVYGDIDVLRCISGKLRIE